MSQPLTAHSHLIIFLHGYGANGSDLAPLARHFQNQINGIQVSCPNAPYHLGVSPTLESEEKFIKDSDIAVIYGCDDDSSDDKDNGTQASYQWFDLDDFALPTIIKGLEISLPAVERLINRLQCKAGVTDQQTFLIGFSQGAMVALHCLAALRRSFAGVISYSGAFFPTSYTKKSSHPSYITDETIKPNTVNRAGEEEEEALIISKGIGKMVDTGIRAMTPIKTPIFLGHGDLDEVVPFFWLERSGQALTDYDYRPITCVYQNIGHSICPQAIADGIQFIKDCL